MGYDVIVGGSHPFRYGENLTNISTDKLKCLDFLDLNGKDVAKSREIVNKTFNLGTELGIPVVTGSDTHQSLQYGCVRTKFDKEINNISDLYNEMKVKNYKIEISPHINIQVKSASLLKKALKEIHNNGGDYVSVL